MKRAIYITLAICLLVVARTTRADDATSETSSDATCGITANDLSAIEAIQNNTSLSYFDELQQELAARKNLLKKTIACAEADVWQAQDDLNNATVDPVFQSLKNQWLDRLNSAISYYNLQLQKTDGAGISGTESIAKEILDWRVNNYAPLAQNISSFVIWSTNQTLFTTAARRLAQVDNLVSSPLFSENSDAQNDYEEAAVSLRAAEDQNTQAQNALAQSLSPEQSLLFIKQSLDSLSSTYQHFFDISNLIQSLLPH
jgi:hypothetical protein